jgi:hypothetical protein
MTFSFSIPSIAINAIEAAMIYGAVMGGVLVGVMIMMFMYMRARRPHAIIVQQRNNAWFKVADVPISLLRDSFDYKGQTYLIKPELAVYLDRGVPYFIYEFGRAEPVTVEHGAKFDARTLKQFVRSNVLTQLLRAAQPQTMGMMAFIFMAIGLVMGLLLGIVVAPYLPAPHAAHLATNSTTPSTTTVPTVPPVGGSS